MEGVIKSLHTKNEGKRTHENILRSNPSDHQLLWFLLVKAIHGARAHVRSPRRATGQKHSCTSNKQANAPPPRRKERQTNGSQRAFPHIPLVPHSPLYSTLLHCLLRSVAYPLPKPTAAATFAAQAKLLPPLPGRRRRPRMLRCRITPGVHTSDSLSLSLDHRLT